MNTGDVGLRISIETDSRTGRVMAVALHVRTGAVAQTRELDDAGTALADYDRDGLLLGIELLAPCTEAMLEKIDEQPAVKSAIRRFADETVPRREAWLHRAAAVRA